METAPLREGIRAAEGSSDGGGAGKVIGRILVVRVKRVDKAPFGGERRSGSKR